MKKLIKSVSLILAAAIVAALALTSCGENTESENGEKTYKIGVIQYMSHPSLDNCYKGIKAKIEEQFGNKATIDLQTGSANSADADCATYAKKMVADKYDMLIAIATPAATVAYAATDGTDIPTIFCAVSDPVAAKLVNSLDNPGGSCTGTSDVLDLEKQVDLIQKMQPAVKTIGVLYTTSEVNSITNLNNLKKIADNRKLTVEASGVQNAADIPSAAAALASKVDCINNFTDNNVVNNLSVLLDAANAKKIPVYGSEIEQVKNGCMASMSIDYVSLGKITGDMAAKVLNGADITKMAVQSTSDCTPVINTEVLSSLGIKMPNDYKTAETVTSAK